ncbi:tyrosine-type recombinase/integrase [Paractinoplanes toevensis]|uniref:Integrase n=1 Tax=Paractinoplanes toevensis TaxID=571911 RepID=A0A919WAR8_9ACTN|nr:tyrosine-type recombinase/integrase [Actinoplanes toevensis]GIM96740.1 hypothetical protein Ato02nite_085330 [Actinoplanes toevensis]
MATLENRGSAIRVSWRLNGSRDGARQSCTFNGPLKDREDLARTAKALVEARGHAITRAQVYAAILGVEPVPDPIPTLRVWAQTWLGNLDQDRLVEPETVTAYRDSLRLRALPKLGHLRLDEITTEGVEQWLRWVNRQHNTVGNRGRNITTDDLLSVSSVNHAYAVLHTCLSAAVPKWLSSNPATQPRGKRRRITAKTGEEPFEGIFLKPHEIALILTNCDPLIRDLVDTALATGMRLGELIALDARHITRNSDQVVVHVRRTVKARGRIGEPKSRAGRRSIPVASDVGRMLWNRALRLHPNEPLFTNRAGRRWTEGNFRGGYWWPAIAAAQRCPEHPPVLTPYSGRGRPRKLDVHEVSTCGCEGRLHCRPRPHDLRHTHASALIRARWSPKKVQVRLGHSSYSITMNTYAHEWDLGEAGELETVNQMLLPARAKPHPAVRRGSVARRGYGRTRLVRR